tara:strand:+ start:263 stop:496 length:234 start_codon:yes stop_codon:yes gene_type:complete
MVVAISSHLRPERIPAARTCFDIAVTKSICIVIGEMRNASDGVCFVDYTITVIVETVTHLNGSGMDRCDQFVAVAAL